MNAKIPKAPCHWNNSEACAWQSGFEAGLEATKAECDKLDNAAAMVVKANSYLTEAQRGGDLVKIAHETIALYASIYNLAAVRAGSEVAK